MPSSTSSSELAAVLPRATPVDVLVTPGMIEAPPYVRPVPAVNFRVAGLVAVLAFAMLLGGWEWRWRSKGARPAIVNSDVLWALQRERIDHGEGDATVLIGDSRMLFDMNLDVWEKLDGRRPIQLALEGTSAINTLEDLAADTAFTGRLFVSATPGLFFSGYSYRGKAIAEWKKTSITGRTGQWLSMNVVERIWAFVDPDFALFTVLARQPWPARAGVHTRIEVRRLAESARDRNTHLWQRLVTDTAYQKLAQFVWVQDPGLPPGVTPAMVAAGAQREIERAVKAVATLRARGVQVLFVRHPSSGPVLAGEDKGFARASTWDVLLKRTGEKGIHFADHAELQGYDIPEWSHLSASEAVRYTAALHGVVSRVDSSFVRR